MGERIGLDVLNTIHDTSVAIAEDYAGTGDFDGLKMELFKTFAMECSFSKEEYTAMKSGELSERLFNDSLELFKQRMERMSNVANPVIKNVFENQGAMYENIMIPITDGKRMYNVSCNLKEAYDTECKAVQKAYQKSIVLHTIDEAWKEHLREMDELRNSVQNASYENKDPLLIYKLESYNLFKSMSDMLNRKTVSILMRGQIPVREEPSEEELRSAEENRRIMEENYRQQQLARQQEIEDQKVRQEMQNMQTNMQPAEPEKPKRTPVRSEKQIRRNDPCPCGSGKKYKNCHGQGL